MDTTDLRIFILECQIEFLREFKNHSEKVIHLSGDKEFIYLNNKSNFKSILYKGRLKDKVFKLDVDYITTSRGVKSSFYGFSNEYGHNVYMVIDEEFLNRIVEILE